MPLHDTLGPFVSRDLNSPYDVANGLNSLYGKLNLTNVGLGTGVTKTQAEAMVMTDPPQAIKTIGYSAIDDMGGALYVLKNTVPDHPGKLVTANGVPYELVPENNMCNIVQFGAKPMSNFTTMPTFDGPEDCYKAWHDFDKFVEKTIRFHIKFELPDVGGPGSGGAWFSSKSWNLRARAYTISGGETNAGVGGYLRFPPYVDGIIINGFHSAGHDYDGYSLTPQNTRKGAAYYKNREQLSPGNVYRCVIQGVQPCRFDLHPELSGSDPLATYMIGDYGFKYETNIGPNSPYDWYLGDNLDFTNAAGTIIENLTLWSFWTNDGSPITGLRPDQNPNVAGFPVYTSAIVMRARAIVRNCHPVSFNGFGLAVVCNGDDLFFGSGQANGWDVEHITPYYNGTGGMHVGFGDANAGRCTYYDGIWNGSYGIHERSFLGNNYHSHQHLGDGSVSPQYLGGCCYNGVLWLAREFSRGGDGIPLYKNEEPGIPGIDAIGNPKTPWTPTFGDGTLNVSASITGSITGTTLTVTAVAFGAIVAGNQLSTKSYQIMTGRVVAGTLILPFGTAGTTGTGGTGTYALDISQTVTSQAMNASLTSIHGTGAHQWLPTTQFAPTYPFGGGTVASRNTWVGAYSEDGNPDPQLGNFDILVGITIGDNSVAGGGTYFNQAWWNKVLYQMRYMPPQGPRRDIRGQVTPAFPGDRVFYSIPTWSGADGRGGVCANWQLINGSGPQSIENTDFGLLAPGGDVTAAWMEFITGANSNARFGRPTSMGGGTLINSLIIGKREGTTDGRLVRYSRFDPTLAGSGGGTVAKGEIIIDTFENGLTTSGRPWGWICIADGDPGTWAVMGRLP
jgi:hypothetical protein